MIHPLNELIPVSDKPDTWESTGIDPFFRVEVPPIPGKGWLQFRFSGSSGQTRNLKFYLDTGDGYNERETLIIGHLSAEPRTWVQYVHFPARIRALRLDVGECPGQFTLQFGPFRPIHPSLVNMTTLRTVLDRRRTFTIKPLTLTGIRKRGLRAEWHDLRHRTLYGGAPAPIQSVVAYRPVESQAILARKPEFEDQVKSMVDPPRISLLVPVYNPEPEHLQACIDSVLAQIYPHWELCLADDRSTNPLILDILRKAAAADSRIKIVFREQNGHICKATNSALEIATGDYSGLLDNDDLLPPQALLRFAQEIITDRTVDYLYSDEDKIDESGRRFEPFFKPGWLPDLLNGLMYTCHLSVYRTSLMRKLGGFRSGFEGSQDHDLCLRVGERTTRVKHIPEVLYHWRVHQNSTAASASIKNYADTAGLRAVQESLARRGEGGSAIGLPGHPGRYYTKYPVKGAPLVSIIIPTRDGAEILETCLKSVYTKTTYSNFEIIIVDNGSVKQETFDLFKRYRTELKERFRVERHDIPFNFSRLNNLGAQVAKGELILMLNNDTEVITPTWLEEMVGWAQRPSIGVVGAMLLFPDETIQHAGVILGIGGVAGHSHKYVHGREGGYFGRLLVPSPYSAVTAACLLVRKSVFDQVGGLSEELQVAFNDVDFCCKVYQLGLQGIVPPQARLFHYESKSRGAEDNPVKQARFTQEARYMVERWAKLLSADPAYSLHLSSTHEDFRLKEV